MVNILLKNWKTIGGVAVIAAIAMAFVVLWAKLETTKSQNQVLVSEKNSLVIQLNVSQESVKTLQSAINEQNDAVEKFRAEFEQREAVSQARLEAAERRAKQSTTRATEIIKFVPDPNLTQCENVEALFNQEIQRAK
jgi:capsular polysaccharide biosynthesis protein